MSLAFSGLLAGAAAPASAAAATCVLGAPTVANAAKPIGVKYPVTRTVTVKVTNCTPTAAKATKVSWWYTMFEASPAQITALKPTYLGANTYSYKGSYTEYPDYNFSHWAGTYPTFVQTVRGNTTVKRTAPAIKLLRATSVTTDASPEPWIKGATFTVKGKVQRADWNTKKYRPYTNHLMDLQFRTPTGSWSTVKQVRSDYDGQLRTTVKANAAGCYRYSSKPNSTSGAANSVGDCVTVSAGTRTVCTGVAGCVISAYGDVDGDRKSDQIGIVTRSTSIIVRVKTGTRTMQTTSKNTQWSFFEPLHAVAPVDGRAGNEIVIGDTTGANTYWYRVVTYRNGGLQTLQPPTKTTVPGRWGMQQANYYHSGYFRSVSSTGVVSLTDKWAENYGSGQSYTGKNVTYRWKSGKWVTASTKTTRYSGYKAAATISGWHIRGIPVWP